MAELRWVPVPGEVSGSPNFSLSGIPVHTSKWIDAGDESVTLPRHKHDSTPTTFEVCEIRDGNNSAKFAVAEISPGGYSYYVLSDDDKYQPVRKAESIKSYLVKTENS